MSKYLFNSFIYTVFLSIVLFESFDLCWLCKQCYMMPEPEQRFSLTHVSSFAIVLRLTDPDPPNPATAHLADQKVLVTSLPVSNRLLCLRPERCCHPDIQVCHIYQLSHRLR